jgi:hypothetical protein
MQRRPSHAPRVKVEAASDRPLLPGRHRSCLSQGSTVVLRPAGQLDGARVHAAGAERAARQGQVAMELVDAVGHEVGEWILLGVDLTPAEHPHPLPEVRAHGHGPESAEVALVGPTRLEPDAEAGVAVDHGLHKSNRLADLTGPIISL